VEKHARARHVTVRLKLRTFVQLAINDDGVGFDPEHHAARRKGKGGLGLLSMRERATYVGGAFTVKSVRGAGTKIEVLIPLPAGSDVSDRGGATIQGRTVDSGGRRAVAAEPLRGYDGVAPSNRAHISHRG
jgi:signal transduction histidine kinase